MNNIHDWARRWGIPNAALAELAALTIPATLPGCGNMPEAEVSAQIRAEAPKLGAVLLRNNSGVGVNPAGRPVRFGLGNDSKALNEVFKSSDLIGMAPDGRFLAVETKAPGWRFSERDKRSVGQNNFLQFVVRRGGIATFATSIEEFKNALGK